MESKYHGYIVFKSTSLYLYKPHSWSIRQSGREIYEICPVIRLLSETVITFSWIFLRFLPSHLVLNILFYKRNIDAKKKDEKNSNPNYPNFSQEGTKLK